MSFLPSLTNNQSATATGGTAEGSEFGSVTIDTGQADTGGTSGGGGFITTIIIGVIGYLIYRYFIAKK